MPNNPPPEKTTPKAAASDNYQKPAAFIVTTFAAALALKHGGFSAALRFYPSGGGGLNFYRHGLRRFAVDYHPFWDKQANANIWRLHYHRGKNFNQVKKHRPYQGGW